MYVNRGLIAACSITGWYHETVATVISVNPPLLCIEPHIEMRRYTLICLLIFIPDGRFEILFRLIRRNVTYKENI